MSEDTILYSCTDQIATITFNRPDKLNAFDDDMIIAFGEALRRFDTDPDANVAILHGAGRAFTSGADVRQRQMRSREQLERQGGTPGKGAQQGELFHQMVNWKPVISAVHGHVLGMGVGFAMDSDLTVAEEGTRFQVTETSRGLGAGRYWAYLHMRGNPSFALDVTLTGRFFTAEEAFAAGLINRLAPKGEGLAQATEMARQINANPPLSVRATVRTRRWYMEKTYREVMMMNAPLKLYLTEDFAESARAFAEKRPAGPFKGR